MRHTGRNGAARLLSLLLALVLLLASCGAGNGGNSMDTAASTAASDAGYGVVTEDAVPEPEETESASSEEAGSLDDNEVPSSGQVNPQDAEVKLIYTANLEMEVLDFDAAVAGLEALVEECGGYIESSNLYAYSARYGSYGGGRSISYTVRVPSGQYRAFLDAAAETENCFVLNLSEDVDDIGTEYFDAETRLATLRTKLERLQELLSQATEMADIIEIESAISETEYEIELYTSTLNRYDSLVDYATVNLYLEEVIDLTEEEEVTFLARVAQSFRLGAQSFVEGVQDLAVWAAYNALWLLVLGLILAAAIVLIRHRRRRKGKTLFRKNEQKKQESKNTSHDSNETPQ